MNTFTELALGGLSLGFLYALIALSFVIVFKATGAFNFAISGFVMVAGLVVAKMSPIVGFGFAVILGVIVAGAIGVAAELLLAGRIKGPERTVYIAIMLLGLDAVLQADVFRQMYAFEALPIGDPWGTSIVTFGDFSVPASRVWAIGVAVVALIAFFVTLRYTNWGIAMRATADDPGTAALVGIRLGWIRSSAWLIAGGFIALAAVFFSTYPSPGFDVAIGVTALRALPAAIIGGLDSPKGAVVGGLLVGLLESFASGYGSYFPILGANLAGVAPYVLLLVILIWRPNGLFGSKEFARV